MLRAVCMVEAHLPVTELDLKLHASTHLAPKIRCTGPTWVTAMWVYEAMWLRLLQLMTNRRSPAVTAMRSFSDYQAAHFAFWAAPDRFAIKPVRVFQEEFVQQAAQKYQIPRELTSSTSLEAAAAKGIGRAGAPDRAVRLAFHYCYEQYDAL